MLDNTSTQFSNVIVDDDPRFNEIWDEKAIIPEEETKESQQRPMTVKNTATKRISILKMKPVKPKREKVTISTITVDDQSVISTIPMPIFVSSVLVDSPFNREVSELTTAFIENTRSSEMLLDRVFLNLYESIVREPELKMSCVSKDSVLETSSAEQTADSFTEDEAQTDYLKHSEPIASVPEFLASTASKFLSSSLSVDENSEASIYFVSDIHFVAEKTHTDGVATTLEEKRLDERNLFDSFSFQATVEPEISVTMEEPREYKIMVSVEENVTEGLGLTLPLSSLQNVKTEDLGEANLETIEVNESGKIVIDEADSCSDSDSSIGKDSHHQVTSSHRDVYISYRIEEDQSDDSMSLSQSQDSSARNSALLTPKQNTGLKSFSIPRWGKKIRRFSGIKDKNDGGTTKPRNSICESRGTETVTTNATFSFSEDSCTVLVQ